MKWSRSWEVKWLQLRRKSYEALFSLVMTDEWRVDGLIDCLGCLLACIVLIEPLHII